jgi:hypothetical protein
VTGKVIGSTRQHAVSADATSCCSPTWRPVGASDGSAPRGRARVFGLPAHPLLVHAVVVLVPLVAIGAVAAVLWPSLRARIGWLLAAGAVLNLVLTPLTVVSGEALEERVRENAALESHAEQGQLRLLMAAGSPAGLHTQPRPRRHSAPAPAR